MRRRVLFFVSAAAALTICAAVAQPQARDAVPPDATRMMDMAGPQDRPFRVQSSVSFFLTGPTGEADGADKLRERARQMIYATAARECDVLKQALASECRLELVNSRINTPRAYGPARQEGINVTGSMTFRITPK